MNCQKCQDQFSDYFDGGLDEAQAKAVKDHLAMCVECEQEFRLLRKSLGALHDTGPVETREGFESYVVTAATQPIEAVACVGYEQLFSDHYDGSLAEERRREFQAHLMACAGCRADYAAFTRSLRALSAKGPVSAPFGFELVARRAAAPPVKTPSLMPVAIAASVVLAFTIGYLIQRAAVSSQLDEKNAAIKKLNKDLDEARRPVVRRDNVARINGVEVPIEEYLENHLAAMGLVHEGKGYIPREFKERFAKGESLVDGKWITVKDEIARHVKDALDKVPKAVAPPTEAEILAKYDLVQTADGYIPRSYVERLQAGEILTAEGKWRSYREIVADALRDRRLVEHEGRWMSEEQRAELLAAQRVKNPGTASSPVTAALDGLVIGAPSGWKNLTLYPLSAPAPRAAGWTTLHDALGTGKVEITDAGVLSAKIRNGGAVDLVVFAGELLIGGRCARVVAKDTIIEKGKTETVEVFDVEPSAYRTSEKFAKESGHYLAAPSLRRALVAGSGQGAVWAYNQQLLGALAPRGSSMADAYKASADPIAEMRAALIDLRETTKDVVGVAVVIGDRLEYAEVFPDHATFCAAYERILRAAALEATMRMALPPQKSAGGLPGSVAGVKRLIESAFEASNDTEGDAVVLRRDSEAIGSALVARGVAAHVVLFAGGGMEPPRATVKLLTAKRDAFLSDYDQKVKAGSLAVRSAVFDELATLPVPEATKWLGAHLTDADVGTRRAVILALGRRNDPIAVDWLLNILNDAGRNPALFPPTVQSLAKLGHVKAVDPFLRLLEGRELEPALIVAAALPELLLQLRDRDVLSAAVGRIMSAYEQEGAPAEYQAALRGTLQITTGKSFTNPVDARRWWNEHGRKFVDERIK